MGFQPNRSIKVSAGDIVRIPAGVPYGYKNTGSEPGTVLLVSPSAGLEKFVSEIGVPISDPASVPTDTAPTTVSQSNITELATVGRKYGIDFLN